MDTSDTASVRLTHVLMVMIFCSSQPITSESLRVVEQLIVQSKLAQYFTGKTKAVVRLSALLPSCLTGTRLVTFSHPLRMAVVHHKLRTFKPTFLYINELQIEAWVCEEIRTDFRANITYVNQQVRSVW